ncbi:MAG TPA: hypothetical protein VHD31_00400 [Candidatus Paceibacterota bacterium]|nr:hypothetical protein [Candidatus Paceibacterota bacterium]
MNKEELRNVASATLSALGFIVGFTWGNAITQHWSLDPVLDFLYGPRDTVAEVYQKLEKYSQNPCALQSCINTSNFIWP